MARGAVSAAGVSGVAWVAASQRAALRRAGPASRGPGLRLGVGTADRPRAAATKGWRTAARRQHRGGRTTLPGRGRGRAAKPSIFGDRHPRRLRPQRRARGTPHVLHGVGETLFHRGDLGPTRRTPRSRWWREDTALALVQEANCAALPAAWVFTHALQARGRLQTRRLRTRVIPNRVTPRERR